MKFAINDTVVVVVVVVFVVVIIIGSVLAVTVIVASINIVFSYSHYRMSQKKYATVFAY